MLAAGKGSSAVIESSNFTRNRANGQGSAVDIDSDYDSDQRPQLSSNRFKGNIGLSTLRYVNFVSWICSPGQCA